MDTKGNNELSISLFKNILNYLYRINLSFIFATKMKKGKRLCVCPN